MLYHFLVPLAKDHIIFNVFRYLTFRSFMALITALVISLVVGPWLIRRLKAMQHGGETIREDTPERHRKTKKGTPTMGGVIILLAILGSTVLWANLGNRYVWVAMLAIAGFGLIGRWDDWTKVRTKRGIPARVKLLAQVVLTLGLLQIVFWQPSESWLPVLASPFLKGWLVNLGWLWIPFAMKTHEGYSTGTAEERSHNYYGYLPFFFSFGLSLHRVHHLKPKLSWLEMLPYVERGTLWQSLTFRRDAGRQACGPV